MARNSTYSAGTAFLTVVPSFLGIEKAFKEQVRDMAAAADKDIASGVARGLKEVNKQAKDSGKTAGRDYAGAYETEAKKTLTKAWQQLPEPQPDVNLRKWDKALAGVRNDMKELSEQRIGIDIDRGTFDRAIADFRKRLEELRDTATGRNREIGFFNAESAAKELRALEDFTDQASRRFADMGDVAGSAFGQRMEKSLRDAISKIPNLKVNADSTEAEQKLAELRARLLELQSKRIGIDIDAGAAFAELKAIKSELEALDRRDVRVDIRTNAHEAAAGLAAIVTQAEQAGAATERIGGRASLSISRLEYLIALGASLGTVIVPAAAAAAGAIALIGTTALAGLSGIGVFALALGGVSDAVKALNQYQNDQAKSAKSVNDANRSVASSTDQVRSAQMSLANTRRNVSEAAEDAARRVAEAEKSVGDARRQAAQDTRDAARAVADARRQVADAEADVGDARRQAVIDVAEADRQVRDAQRSVTDAERDAIDVRKALTQAIDDAKTSMLELDAQLHRNELDQQKAITAQMQALEELNKLKTNPRATDIELRQAQDAYDEQTVRLEELGVKHKELAAEKAKYDKEGVEGDEQVIAARKRIAEADQKVADAREKLSREQAQRRETEYKAEKRIADAQERVARAQEQVSRAQEQQRETEIRGQERIASAQKQVADARRQQARQAMDGQYQLAQASQAVESAQRAQQAAWEKVGVAGGAALDTLKEKMANLSPAQQHFAEFIFGLKDEMLRLRAAAAEPLLPQLETAITNLLKYLPNVEKFVSKVAKALGEIAIQAVDALGDPVWQNFFGYIDRTAVPSLHDLWETGKNLTEGLISLFMALTPFNKPVGTGLVDLSRDFAEWAARLDKTQGYKDFIDYVTENGPRVVHFLGEVGLLFIELVKASAPLGSIVLRVLTLLVDALNSIPDGVLTGLVLGIGSLSLVLTGLGAVMRGVKLKRELTEIFGPRSQDMIQKYAIDTGRATDETGRFGKMTATVAGMTVAARDKISGYATTMSALPGRAKEAVTGSTLFTRSMDAVRTGATATAGAVTKVSGAVQGIGPKLVSFAGTARDAAKNGVDRLKTSMLEMATAANGPGGLAAGLGTAGGKLTSFATTAADTASKLGGKVASGTSAFAGALGNIATKAGAAASTIATKLMRAGGSLIGMLGGPWGVAIAGATAALGYFAAKSSEQKAKVDTLKAALGELSSTYRDLAATGGQASAAADDAFRNIVRNNPELQKAVIQLDHLGVSFNEMVKAAASGDPSEVLKKLNEEIERTTRLSNEFDQRNAAARGAYGTNPYKGQIEGLKQVRDAFEQNAKAIGQAEQAERILNSTNERNIAMANIQKNAVGASTAQLSAMATAWDTNQIKIDELNATLGNFGDDAAAATRRADDLTAAIQRQYGAAINANEASENWNSTLLSLSESAAANGRTLDIHSRAGLANRDAIEQAAKSARDLFIEEVKQGGKLPEVTAKHQDRINKLKDEAAKTFGAKSEAVKLIDIYGKIDPSITTKYSTQGFDAVFQQAQKLQFAQTMLELGITDPKEAEARWKRQNAILNNQYPQGAGGTSRKATGGAIAGPGTGTSDDVPIMASDGEHMLTAAEVKAAGGHEAIYAWRQALMMNRRIPSVEELPHHAVGGAIERVPAQRTREGLPGYAKGGAIAPFIVNLSGTKLPTMAQALSKVQAPDGTFNGVFSPNETVAEMQKFALAQRGKRYLWAAVGPDRYDCSGLVGNLYAIATGRKKYRRYMSTADMGPGKHGMVAGPGKYFTVYLGPGHTAANVGGLHAEAYGGNGTPLAIGRIGTRLSYYNQKLHLPGFAEGGAVDTRSLETKQDRMISFLRYGWPEPPAGAGFDKLLESPLVNGKYDAGGWLPPGYSTVVNNTGRPEPVLTNQQWQDITALARNGGGNTYQFAFRDTTLDPAELRRIQDREAVLARAERPR